MHEMITEKGIETGDLVLRLDRPSPGNQRRLQLAHEPQIRVFSHFLHRCCRSLAEPGGDGRTACQIIPSSCSLCLYEPFQTCAVPLRLFSSIHRLTIKSCERH